LGPLNKRWLGALKEPWSQMGPTPLFPDVDSPVSNFRPILRVSAGFFDNCR
jgi:hypothetical protein